MFGIAVIDKPEGITSHDVVSKMRRRFETRRVGHAGTLDPLATGVLVLAIGPATRFLQYLPLEPKEYVTRIKFGESTNTYDAEGEVTSTRDVPDNLEAALLEVLGDYVGEIEQLPPMYSAVKKDGKPLYAYARKGEDVEREKRKIYVDELELVGVDGNEAVVRMICSGGTYVRTLAHDVGEQLGCGGHVIELRRTRVGKFDLEHAKSIEEISAKDLIPLNLALLPMPLLELNGGQVEHIRQGRQILTKEVVSDEMVGLLDGSRNVIGVGRVMGSRVQPECVIPLEAMIDG